MMSNPMELCKNVNNKEHEEKMWTLKMKLWKLLEHRLALYTMGDSTSVPKELAQRILDSICYVLQFNESTMDNTALEYMLEKDLDKAYNKGIKQIEDKIQYGMKMWNGVCLSAPSIKNISFTDTIKSIGLCWKKYDYNFFASDIPCDIDYQLCYPVSEELQGIDYVNRYLENLIVENAFINKFNVDTCKEILSRYCKDYIGLLINMYEPIATNALGLAILGKDIKKLTITSEERKSLKETMCKLSKEQLNSILLKGCEIVECDLQVNNTQALKYLRRFCESLVPRIDISLKNDNLKEIFL